LAKLTRELVESGKEYGIYHGANGGVCSWHELGKKALDLKNIKIDISAVSGDKFPRPAKRPVYSPLLNTKLEKQRNWQEALEEYLKK
jgi:dTDP-4-dehydrorhamnose reductase